MDKQNKYWVIIPVYNEAKHIKSLIKTLNKYTKNIIVVNDGSTDNTLEIIDKISRIKVVNLKKNSGKGAAMKSGAKYAWKLGAQGIIFIDGDNQHNPKHLPKFFNLLKTEHIIIGVRILKTDIPHFRKFGNNLALILTKILFQVDIPDLLCGFRAFSKKGYRSILWQANNYGVETEVITLIGRKKLRFKTVIVDTIYLDKYKGFSVKDGLGVLLKLPYWKFRKI